MYATSWMPPSASESPDRPHDHHDIPSTDRSQFARSASPCVDVRRRYHGDIDVFTIFRSVLIDVHPSHLQMRIEIQSPGRNCRKNWEMPNLRGATPDPHRNPPEPALTARAILDYAGISGKRDAGAPSVKQSLVWLAQGLFVAAAILSDGPNSQSASHSMHATIRT
jgi:hypothetical protein